ncbi:MAG: AmmeMemoRadiSam system radical SAM enzyme [Planctomycetes bacterium]|nr:AmmeMemoRadiSam system radical SAM enzyme [Planctomycetota bacterium]
MQRNLREAILWSQDGDVVDCFLCNHRCTISEDHRGFCGMRENRQGTLYSLVYGHLVTSSVEFIEKKPLYHFQPGSRSYSIATPGCNFRCPWCQNWRISHSNGIGDLNQIAYTDPSHVVEKAKLEKCQSVCYTYTEPTIFMEYALDTARLAQKDGLKNVFVTNGYQTPEAVDTIQGLIDAANIDLKSFSDDFYKEECGARLEPVLETIKNMYRAGIHVEVTTLVVPGLNDSDDELSSIASFLSGISEDLPWHVTRFHPDFEAQDINPTPRETIRCAIEIGREEGLQYVYAGNIALPEGRDTVCPNCGHSVIQRGVLGETESKLEGDRCPHCGFHLPVVV